MKLLWFFHSLHSKIIRSGNSKEFFFQRGSVQQGHRVLVLAIPQEVFAVLEESNKDEIMDLLPHCLLKPEVYGGLDQRMHNPRSPQLLNLHLNQSLDFSFKKAQ